MTLSGSEVQSLQSRAQFTVMADMAELSVVLWKLCA